MILKEPFYWILLNKQMQVFLFYSFLLVFLLKFLVKARRSLPVPENKKFFKNILNFTSLF